MTSFISHSGKGKTIIKIMLSVDPGIGGRVLNR